MSDIIRTDGRPIPRRDYDEELRRRILATPPDPWWVIAWEVAKYVVPCVAIVACLTVVLWGLQQMFGCP